MYLKGSKWSMNRRRTRPNWFRIILLVFLIAGGVYVDRFIIPTRPSPFVPTQTATRAPESYLTEAESLFNAGKLLQSIELYQQAIAADPQDENAYIALARVQVFAGQYKDAQTSAEDALLLNPNNSMAHALRAWSLDFQGNYLEAEAAIKRALELDPNNGLAHAFYVEILVDSYVLGGGSFEVMEKAIEESKVALALAPNTLETHRARGYILEATANYEDAIHEYQAAIAINSNIPDLHLAVGRNYRALGIYDQAVEEFTRANSLNPSDPTPDLLISRTYATVGEYHKAAQYAETAVRDAPTDPNLRGNLGVMYYRMPDWPKAVQQLSLAIRGGNAEEGGHIAPLQLVEDTHIAEYYFTYALVLAKLNRCGDALQVARTIKDTLPSDELSVGNADEAIRICQKNLESPATSTPAIPEDLTPTPSQ
jgi:tetratricopeptide (TPR) repeat protein